MRNRLLAPVLFALVVAASACSDSPTSPAVPQSPRYDEVTSGGGWTAGSGNKAAPTQSSADGTATSTTTPVPCEPDGRGGWTAGSGIVGCTMP